MFKKIISLCLICLLTVTIVPVTEISAAVSYNDLLLDYEISDIIGYEEYKSLFTKNETGDITINATTTDIVAGEGYTATPNGIYTRSQGYVQWKINVPETGFYQIGFTYIAPESCKNEIIRQLNINGECPFEESKRIIFSRTFADNGEITQDTAGNDVLPEQIAVEREAFKWADGADGYYPQPYIYYMSAGENTISLISVAEALIIKEVSVTSVRENATYKQVLSEYKKQGLSEQEDFSAILQAETPDYKSASTISAVSDRASPLLEDYSGNKTNSITTKLNILGGGRFASGGMWAEYSIDSIPQDGLYKIVFKAKQDAANGTTVSRKIYVNGQLPFKEAENFEFSYSSDYKNVVFGNEDGAYLVPLKKGSNTLKIESTLGSVADYCRSLEQELEVLNRIYRKFITIMGTNPDANRDYDVEDKLPEEVALLSAHSEKLFEISSALEEQFGSSNYTSIINTVALQLQRMAEDTYTIPSNVASLNSNISSLGSVVNGLQETDLDLDYIIITTDTEALPKASANIFENIAFTFKNFLYSFTMDYNALSTDTQYESSIEVWFLGGREQAQVLKNLITSDFSNKHKISATLKLVSLNNTLLQATLAGRGPDVALGITSGDTMNYAFRKALVNLAEFEDFEQASNSFPTSALATLSNNGKVYGLPQTMTYPVMFYRADILKELGIKVPETWDEVYGILPILAQNNMTFGLPTPSTTSTTFMSLLYQQGGSIYTEDLKTANFYDESTIKVMRQWVKFYSSYGLPLSYDFVNRFAAGSMPIAIADYAMYNNMCLYAPQMENQWSFTVIPGTVQSDGTVDHTAPVTVTAAIVFAGSDSVPQAYSFVKWWTSADIQGRYGVQIENLLGKAGRYATANTTALANIPWTERFYKNLMAQREYTLGVPEVPGGYYTTRYITNAFMESYNNGTDARETMYEYHITVNQELTYQRNVLEME